MSSKNLTVAKIMSIGIGLALTAFRRWRSRMALQLTKSSTPKTGVNEMRSITKLSLVVAALVLTGTALQAQTNNASITATASVQTPINVLGAQQLSFGNVFPGVNKTVVAMDLANAGRFDISGQASTPVTLM